MAADLCWTFTMKEPMHTCVRTCVTVTIKQPMRTYECVTVTVKQPIHSNIVLRSTGTGAAHVWTDKGRCSEWYNDCSQDLGEIKHQSHPLNVISCNKAAVRIQRCYNHEEHSSGSWVMNHIRHGGLPT